LSNNSKEWQSKWSSYKDQWKSQFNEGVPSNFNMAVLYLFRLNDLLEQCSRARYERNQIVWFTALHEVWTNLSWKVVQETESDNLENEINADFAEVEKYFGSSQVDNLNVQQQSITFAELKLALISKKINILLYRYGLLMPFPKHGVKPGRAVADFGV